MKSFTEHVNGSSTCTITVAARNNAQGIWKLILRRGAKPTHSKMSNKFFTLIDENGNLFRFVDIEDVNKPIFLTDFVQKTHLADAGFSARILSGGDVMTYARHMQPDKGRTLQQWLLNYFLDEDNIVRPATPEEAAHFQF